MDCGIRVAEWQIEKPFELRITNYDSRCAHSELRSKKKVTCSENKSPFPVLLFNYGWRSGEISVVDKIHFNRTD